MEFGTVRIPWGELPEAAEVESKDGRFEGTGTIVEVVELHKPRRVYLCRLPYNKLAPLVQSWQPSHNFLTDTYHQGDVLLNAVIDFARPGHSRNAEHIVLWPLHAITDQNA